MDPIAKMTTNYVRLQSLQQFQVLSVCLVLLSAVLVMCASFPDDSPIYKGYGGALPVVVYVCIQALFGFSNTCMFRYFKQELGGKEDEKGLAIRIPQDEETEDGSHSEVQRAYKVAGVATQLGAFLGSMIAFGLV
eukprot:gene24010-25642_t